MPSLYARQGYIVFKQLFSPQHIDCLRTLIKPIYQQWVAENRQQPGYAQVVNMHSLTLPHYFQQHPAQRLALFNALAHPALIDKLGAVFGPDLYFHNTQLFFNPQDETRQNYWHRDLQYSPIPDAQQAAMHQQLCSLHVRIPLLDEAGIELIPHSHQHWDSLLQRQVRFALNGHQQHEDLAHAELISLHAGDVLLFNAQMIHRGRYDLSAQRLALDICIGKPHPALVGFVDPVVQPATDELLQIQHPAWYRAALQLISANNKGGN